MAAAVASDAPVVAAPPAAARGPLPRSAVYNMLLRTPVTAVVPRRRVVTLSSRDSVATALRTLSGEKILSAPVLLDGDPTSVLALITVMDLVAHLLRHLDAHVAAGGGAPDGSVTADMLADYPMDKVTLAEVVAEFPALRESFTPHLDHHPASFLLDLFVAGQHRALLFAEERDEQGAVTGVRMSEVCSQSDIVRFIAERLDDPALRELAATRVSDLGWEPAAVITVASDQPVFKALQKMRATGMRSLAVLDPKSGALTGTFSTSDLRGLTPDKTNELLWPVGAFLSRHSATYGQPVTAFPHETFGALVRRFARERFHQLWVVRSGENELRVTGIVTLTDVLRMATRVAPPAEAVVALPVVLPVPGELSLTLVSASGLPSSSLFFGINPYAVVRWPHETRVEAPRSKVHMNTTAPTFDETFVCHIGAAAAAARGVVSVEIFSKSFRPSDALVARVQIPLPWVLNGFGTGDAAARECRDAFDLESAGGGTAGKLLVVLKYEPNAGV
jgi:CBS domain-containing protein